MRVFVSSHASTVFTSRRIAGAFAALMAVAAMTSSANSIFAQAGAVPNPAPRQAPPAAAPPVAPPAAPTTPPAVKPATPAAADEAIEVEEARQMSVTTDDGVAIKFSYYPSSVEESVPVILLHGGGGSRDDLKGVAEFLQSKGHTVVLPDLRGHGESTEQTKAGKQITLNSKTQSAADINAMVTQDMTKLWNFLVAENNEKVVNIKKLCVVGVDMGAIVAINFVAKNYMEPDYRNQPRGKDVKALVLVSPPSAYRGASFAQALKQPPFKGEIASLVAVGAEGSAEVSAARKLEGMLTKFAGPPKGKDKLVLLAELKTKLQAAQLLSNPQLKLGAAVDGFIQKMLVQKSFPWAKQILPGA